MTTRSDSRPAATTWSSCGNGTVTPTVRTRNRPQLISEDLARAHLHTGPGPRRARPPGGGLRRRVRIASLRARRALATAVIRDRS